MRVHGWNIQPVRPRQPNFNITFLLYLA
jgi:hypothetical protein